ncbi:MAG: PAS domain S-box protein [Sulfurimonas sp.]|nr:PAS domain S-box protein [Sulfurimonas sp.]
MHNSSEMNESEMLKERYELVIKGSQLGVWEWNLLTNELYLSPRWKEMVGYSDDELENCYETWASLVHPDDFEQAKIDIQKSLEKPDVFYENIHRLKHKNGHYIWNMAKGLTIFEDDKPVRMVGSHNDITKIKELESQNELLQTAFNHAQMSFVLTDKDGNIEYVNPWFAKLTGYSPEEVKGQNPRILKTDYLAPEDYVHIWEELTHDHIWRGVFKNKKKDGATYWEAATIVPIKNEHGEIIKYIGLKNEITDEVNLKENVERLAAIIDSAQIEMYVFGANDLKFLYANRAALENIGYELKEIFDKTPFEIKNLPRDEFIQKIKPLESELKSIDFEAIHKRKDGSLYPVNAIVQKTRFWGKEAYLAIVYDISEHKKMLQKLQETQEMMLSQSRHAAMGEMIGMIAHQWRQPISVISMIVNNMLVDLELSGVDEEECLHGAKNILGQIDYLSKTIDDFRDFFRPNKEKESIKIINIAKEVETIIGASLTNHNIEFTIQNSTTKEVKTFSRELLQVFMNILKNAKEALGTDKRSNKKIVLSIYEEDGFVTVQICDNGAGIKSEVLPRIFEPYFSTKDQKTGSGLGLYMSKIIVEKHLGGTIFAQNSKEGGACFWVKIPL